MLFRVIALILLVLPFSVSAVTFSDNGQIFESADGLDIGDLDGDGDLDIFAVRAGTSDNENRVYINDGSGFFTDSGQLLGDRSTHGVALGDLDGDGDLDAYVSFSGGGDRVWINDGSGIFTDTGQSVGTGGGYKVALGDFDNDNDLDAFVTDGNKTYGSVYFNNGSGFFSFRQSVGSGCYGLALGDVDGDTDLDVVAACGGTKIFLNESGIFSDSGQDMYHYRIGVDLGDLDSDGDLDIFSVGPTEYYVAYNDGEGTFIDAGYQFEGNYGSAVALGDLDWDGDLDAWVANKQNSSFPSASNLVWLNYFDGNFYDSGQSLGDGNSVGVHLGDFDGDGDLDSVVANTDLTGIKVWLNVNSAPVLTSVSPSNGPTAGGLSMVLQGQNFSLTPTVTIDGVPCPQTYTSLTLIVCTVPEGTGVTNPVLVTASGQASNTLNFVYDSPVLNSVTPNIAPSIGGTTLTLIGMNFGASGATVSVGGADCPVVSQGHTEIQCTVAAGSGKDLPVSVTQDGQTSSELVLFSYTYALTVNASGNGSITSSPGSIDCGTDCSDEFIVGEVVHLSASPDSGWSFGSWGGDCAGSGSTTCDLTMDSDKDVQATFIVVTGPPVLTGITPGNGPTQGGVTLLLSGSDFGTIAGSVSIGIGVCSIVSWADTSIQCILPAGQGTGLDVQVVSAGAESSNTLSFSYDAPVLTSLSPSDGPTAGGISLTLEGTNFGLTPVVTVDGIVCPQTSTSHGVVVCTLPEGTGTVNPVELAVGGQTVNNLNFAYDAPTLSGVTPELAPATGGATLTLNGTNFGAAAATAAISGVDCPVSSQSHTQIQCTVAAGIGKDLPVIVTLDGQESTESVTFSYTHAVNVNVSGAGNVLSTPSGINCGTACEAQFISNDVISLFAYADLGWSLESWGADCAGSGSTTCSLSMDSDKTAAAIFACVHLSIPAQPSIVTTEVYECFDIEVNNALEILTINGDVTFHAENSISIGPGFRVGNEAKLRANTGLLR